MTLYGGIEAGGTKFNCIIGTEPDDIRDEIRFPTTTPDETIGQAVAFFEKHQADLTAIGIASFGPVDLHQESSTYGFITATPKPDWSNTDLVGPIREAVGVPVAFDTDVNGAAVGEGKWGAGQGLESFLYLTIGTGIGGGGMMGGRMMHGMVHPEIGHIRIPHDLERDPYQGHCPFHKDCFEGLASGPAMNARWKQPAEILPADHEAWRLEAHYIAHALVNLICTVSPQRIILGGGVMHQMSLFPMIREEVVTLLNGYVQHPAILEEIDRFIVPPGLGDRAGSLGAIGLAMGV